jgi:hypothetical protein
MEVRFVNDLYLEVLGDRAFKLSEPLFVIIKNNNEELGFIVPKGFETDLASVPRVPVAWLLVGGIAHKSAVMHDYFYRTGSVSKEFADSAFFYGMETEGISYWRRWLMYKAVDLFGGNSYKGKK